MAKKNKKRLSERLYKALNEIVAKQRITDGKAYFDREGDVITSQGTREALNRSDTKKDYVKATHWFDIFWYYVRIEVRKDTDGISEIPFVSVSFRMKVAFLINCLGQNGIITSRRSIHNLIGILLLLEILDLKQ